MAPPRNSPCRATLVDTLVGPLLPVAPLQLGLCAPLKFQLTHKTTVLLTGLQSWALGDNQDGSPVFGGLEQEECESEGSGTGW